MVKHDFALEPKNFVYKLYSRTRTSDYCEYVVSANT